MRLEDKICEDFKSLPVTKEAHERALAACGGSDRWSELATAAARFWCAVHRFHHCRDNRGAVEEGDRALAHIERVVGGVR